MMTEVRKGRQTPTRSVVLPYTSTLGGEAIELYNSTGRTAQEWQELLVSDILAYNEDGLWIHTKYGYSVPRRNGKNEIVVIRELIGLKQGEKILHTAHRTTTTHAAWERLLDLVEKAGMKVLSSYRAYGKEHIEVEGGGKIEFRTRTSKGGLGEGFDLLIIDEAQEYQDDQESALKYVVTDSHNPQTILCGTPPTPVSSGTVFTKYRKDTLAGLKVNSGWAEWSVDYKVDPRDIECWYETNPSLGTIFTERSVTDEIGSDDLDFNIQRLGLWIRYNQKSAISPNEWKELQIKPPPKLTGDLFVGIKYGHDGENVAMSVAARTEDGEIFVEGIDCREVRAGTDWMMKYLSSWHSAKVVIDGANGQKLLADEMKEWGLSKPVLPTVKEIIVANAAFEQGLFQRTIRHAGQPSVINAVGNCEKRAIGSNGGFGYRSIKEGVEIALLDSIILAYWICSENKKKKKRKQKISY